MLKYIVTIVDIYVSTVWNRVLIPSPNAEKNASIPFQMVCATVAIPV